MWLRTDEREDTLTSLSLCLMCLEVCEEEPAIWKWAVLALHNALQGAMVCHLSGTAQIGALKDSSAKAWLEWHERDGRGEIKRSQTGIDEMGLPITRITNQEDLPPTDRLADASELFKRLYCPSARWEQAGAILEVTKDEKDAFAKLHDLRNDFSHFTPKGWSIELSGLPQIFLHVASVIEKIANDPWPFRHLKEERRRNLMGTLEQLRLRAIQL